MPILTVLVNDQGEVLGTAMTQIQGQGTDVPGRVSLVARPGQQVIEIEVGEDVLNLDPPKLHEFIQAHYLHPGAERAIPESQSISADRQTGMPREDPRSPSEDRDLVITPAGPRPRDRVHGVRPNEAVRRIRDGTYAVVPADASAEEKGRNNPPADKSRRQARSQSRSKSRSK